MPDSTDPVADTPSGEQASASAPAVSPPPSSAVAGQADARAAAAVDVPPENIGRGLLLSLVAIPVGVVAWVLIWQLGFVSAIVSFGVVTLAAFLYRLGSGGRVSGVGVAMISGVTVITLVIAFFGGLAFDIAAALEYPMPASLTDSLFWSDFTYNVTDNPAMWQDYTMSIVMSVVFAALGIFGVMRRLVRSARAAA